tara:strand:+ start:6979 stop:8376 length:1398 start_codon:yes stop_codon:yes gene_type:complete
MSVEVNFRLHKQQGLAMRIPAQEILYGGAAGGGKSHLLRVAFITWALECPGIQQYLFRRTFPQLFRNHMKGPTSFPELLGPLIREGRCKIVKNEIRFSNGSNIFLSHMQHAKNLQDYQGTEIHVLGFDEGTHFNEEEYSGLRGRVRLGGWKPPPGCKTLFPRILIGTNPGGRGHHFFKKTFVEPGPYRIHKAPADEGGMLRAFVPARLEDNPSMTENDPDYRERLLGLGDPLLVRAMLEGDWDIVAGAMYGETWKRGRHVCNPFAIPQDWKIWIGADDGFAAPAALIWLAQDPRIKTIYAIRELYRKGMLPESMAEQAKEIHYGIERAGYRIGDQPRPNESAISGLMDSGAFADQGQGMITRGKQLQQLGVNLKPCKKWPGSRVARAQNLHRMLAPNNSDPAGLPGLRFFDGHVSNTIRTVPALARDENNAEDVDTDDEDHAYDGLTYGLQHVGQGVKRVKFKGA